jgi:hypothetical protein
VLVRAGVEARGAELVRGPTEEYEIGVMIYDGRGGAWLLSLLPSRLTWPSTNKGDMGFGMGEVQKLLNTEGAGSSRRSS